MTSARITWKKWTIVASLFTATALVCVPAVGQKTQSVLVVNGSGQPVPTAAEGTTNVAGTVNIGNAPSVNVANTPTVNLEGLIGSTHAWHSVAAWLLHFWQHGR